MSDQPLNVERERLDHQRSRIEEILGERMVSPDMERHLRGVLDDIVRRLAQIDVTIGSRQLTARTFDVRSR